MVIMRRFEKLELILFLAKQWIISSSLTFWMHFCFSLIASKITCWLYKCIYRLIAYLANMNVSNFIQTGRISKHHYLPALFLSKQNKIHLTFYAQQWSALHFIDFDFFLKVWKIKGWKQSSFFKRSRFYWKRRWCQTSWSWSFWCQCKYAAWI